MRKIFKITLVAVIMVAWVFSGWPQIWHNPQIPREPQRAEAAIGGNEISSIVTLSGTTGTGASTAPTFSGGTALNKMFHFCSFDYNTSDSLHDQTYKTTELTAIDTLTITAGQTGGSNQSLNYDCTIVIYTSGSDLVVNRYTSDTTPNPPPQNVTITAVSATNQAFVIPHGERDPSDTTIGSEEIFEYQLTSTTNVQIEAPTRNNSSGGNTVRFEVVDWNNSDINVQHINDVTMTSGETTDTASITSVDTGKTWLIATGISVGSGFSEQTGRMNFRTDLQDSTTVRARRGVSGLAFDWSVQVIEDVSSYGLWNVQMGNINMTTGQTSNTLTLSPAVDTANTVVFCTAFVGFACSGQSADTTTSNHDNVNTTVTLTDSTTITATRGVTDTQALDVFVQAIEFLPSLNQSAYRWFNNDNSTDVGSALATQDTAATLGSSGDAFRLRLLLHVSDAQLSASGDNFKLQFATQSGSCDTGFSGESYADVTAATAIAYNNNATPADGDNLTDNANDPAHSGHTNVNQDYEELNNFTNSVAAISPGQDGLWDFSLIDNSAPADTAYCFRVVESDNTVLDTYTVVPQVTTASAANSLPTTSSVSIDSGAGSVTLTENTTKTVSCVGTVTDTDGFADINAVGAYLFRTGAGTSTPTNNNYQYYLYGDSACVPSGGSGNTETYTCDFSVEFYAHPTDSGSPHASDDWTCEMWPEDATATGTPSTDDIEMSSLLAIDVTSTINYGSVTAGSDTDTTNQTTTITNTGNRDIDVELSGDLMCTDYSACTGGVIQPGEQKYADGAFTYSSGGTALSATTSPVQFELNLPAPQATTTPVTDDVLWGTAAPDGSIVGSYTGQNTFTAVGD